VKTGWPSAPGTAAQPAFTTHTPGVNSLIHGPRRGRDTEQPAPPDPASAQLAAMIPDPRPPAAARKAAAPAQTTNAPRSG